MLFLGCSITMVDLSPNMVADASSAIGDMLGFDALPSSIIASAIFFMIFFVLGWLIEHVFEHYFKKLAAKTKTKLDDEILKNIKRPIYVLVIFFGFFYAYINLQPFFITDSNIQGIIEGVLLLIQLLLVAYIFTRVTNVLFAWYAERQEKKNKSNKQILYVFRGIFNAIVYLVAFFVFMALRQVDLTGLAIGASATAIVIGFALQHMLSDFFSAF